MGAPIFPLETNGEPGRPERIERIRQVMARTGLSRSSLYAAVKAGTFPKPRPISVRAVGFVGSEVDEWIRSIAAAKRGRSRATDVSE